MDWRAASDSMGPFPFRFREAFFPDEEIYGIGETLKESDIVSQSKAPLPVLVPRNYLDFQQTHCPLPTSLIHYSALS